jgi:3-hydroxybutyrate dehydrogenase
MDSVAPAPAASTRALAGRTAIVTGSTSGIGLEIAATFARAGATVVVNGLGDAGEITALCERLQAQTQSVVRYSPADMANPAEIAAMMADAERDFGAVDILVNNAGVQHVEAVETFPAAKWDLILAVNLSSAFHTIHCAVAGMKRRGFGRIVNVASAHALVASPFKSAYVAAKHGLAGLTKTVALETAEHGITCNAICPGYVLTPLVERQIPETAKARGISEEEVVRTVLLAAQPTHRFVATAEIGALALFLCGEAAASITGAILPVDGGWTAQ